MMENLERGMVQESSEMQVGLHIAQEIEKVSKDIHRVLATKSRTRADRLFEGKIAAEANGAATVTGLACELIRSTWLFLMFPQED